jgi:hypothetical protein
MSNEDQRPKGSEEPTMIMGQSGDATPPAPKPSTPPEEPVRPLSKPSPSDATVIGKSAMAMQVPEPKPAAKLSDTQDTVVSPRLRQLAQTPGQPLRPPQSTPPRAAARANQPAATGSPSRLYMLIGFVAILILLAVILVGVIVAQKGPALVAGLFSTPTPTRTPTRPATVTLPPTATRPPVTPTLPPTPIPPTPAPRPAPTTLAKDVLAKVTPPEGVKLKVRDQASTAGKLLGELERDAEVAIVDGPVDANGLRWWKVDNRQGLVGWSAEGVGNEKYLLPVGWAK